MSIAEGIFLACGATSLVVAAMLLRQYLRVRSRLLLWSVICFVGLAANNVLVYVDMVMFTGVDLSLYRAVAGTIAVAIMVYGLVWETRS
ncbi:MAG TPA: DUF5985 family protein [Vicinamibacterales bacterium]|jgi:hypothetical protein|nr:DUF5985 family protein [Vicinamibacterales bacterium]